ncbi:MAG: acyloxyacyl hydrolase [Gammaproteobacteria bacterium]
MKYQRSFASALGLIAAMMSHAIQAIDFLALEVGTGEESAERIGIAAGWRWGRGWSLPAGLHLSGHWELSLSYWDGDEGRTGNDTLVEGGLAPVFRIHSKAKPLGITPFIEGAVGIHLMSDTELGDKDFDIPFTFGSHGGVGFRFGPQDHIELGYRFQHLSNADLGDPNPGINFHLIRLLYYF